MHQNIPLYDVSNTCFIYGVTNFNLANALAALRSINVIERRKLYAKLNVTAYDNLAASGQIEFRGDSVFWCNFEVTIDPDSDCQSAIVDSILSDGHKFVTLRTREF
jgi:hypothetical protein